MTPAMAAVSWWHLNCCEQLWARRSLWKSAKGGRSGHCAYSKDNLDDDAWIVDLKFRHGTGLFSVAPADWVFSPGSDPNFEIKSHEMSHGGSNFVVRHGGDS